MLMALPLGHLLSCFSDTFTRQGVQLFWPEPVWAVSVSNPNRRLTTGGTGEYWVLAIALALLILGYNLAGGGGITTTVGEGLRLRDCALVSDRALPIATYNQNAATNVIYAKVKGVWASDRTRADGRYEVLAATGSEFLVTDGQGVYKTGQQFIVDKSSWGGRLLAKMEAAVKTRKKKTKTSLGQTKLSLLWDQYQVLNCPKIQEIARTFISANSYPVGGSP